MLCFANDQFKLEIISHYLFLYCILFNLQGVPLVVFGSMSYTNYVDTFYRHYNEYLQMADVVLEDIFKGVSYKC